MAAVYVKSTTLDLTVGLRATMKVSGIMVVNLDKSKPSTSQIQVHSVTLISICSILSKTVTWKTERTGGKYCILAKQALKIWDGYTLVSAGLNFWVLLPN